MPDSPGLYTILDTNYWDTFVQVSGSDFTTSSTSLVNITGLTFPALANAKYEIEIVLATQSSDTNGLKVAVNFSAAGATGAFNTVGGGVVAVGAGVSGNVFGTAEPSAFVSVAATTATVWSEAIVVIGANAGNITATILKVTAGTATVFIGSVMKIKKLV